MDAVLAVFVIIMSLLILISVLGGSIYPATEKFTSVDPMRILGQPFAMWNDAYKHRVEGFAEMTSDTNSDETVSEVSAQASDSPTPTPPPPPPTTVDTEPTQSTTDDSASTSGGGGGDTTEEYRDYVAEDYYAYDTSNDENVAMGMGGTVVEGFPGNMYAAYAPTSAGACM